MLPSFIPSAWEIEDAARAERIWDRAIMARDHYSQMAQGCIRRGDDEGTAQWAATAATYGREILCLLGNRSRIRPDEA